MCVPRTWTLPQLLNMGGMCAAVSRPGCTMPPSPPPDTPPLRSNSEPGDEKHFQLIAKLFHVSNQFNNLFTVIL